MRGEIGCASDNRRTYCIHLSVYKSNKINMGVPGLHRETSGLSEYVNKALLAGCEIHVDLANVSHTLFDLLYRNKLDMYGTGLNEAFIISLHKVIRELEKFEPSAIRFYSDGGYPPSKIPELVSRQRAKARKDGHGRPFAVSDFAAAVVRQYIIDQKHSPEYMSIGICSLEAEDLLVQKIASNLDEDRSQTQVIVSQDTDFYLFDYGQNVAIYMITPVAIIGRVNDPREHRSIKCNDIVDEIQFFIEGSAFRHHLGKPIETDVEKLQSRLKEANDSLTTINYHIHELVNVYDAIGKLMVFLPFLYMTDTDIGWKAGEQYRLAAWKAGIRDYAEQNNKELPSEPIELEEQRVESHVAKAIVYTLDFNEEEKPIDVSKDAVFEYIADMASTKLSKADERKEHIKAALNKVLIATSPGYRDKTFIEEDVTSHARILIALYSLVILKSIRPKGLEWLPETFPWMILYSDVKLPK